MLLSWVTFVVVPTVVGIEFVLLGHIVVSVGLGQNRGGSDGLVFGIAFDDALERDVGLVDESVAVDEQIVGFGG